MCIIVLVVTNKRRKQYSTQREVQELIAQGRQSLQMSQRDFAKAVGLSAAKLSYFETGARQIKIPRDEPALKKMAELFKCDWHLLIPDPPARPKIFDQLATPVPTASANTLPAGEEEMNDPAMVPLWAQAMKCTVKVVNRKAVSGDYVKIKNRVNNAIGFRLLFNEAGCLFLHPLNKHFQTFTYDPDGGMFEIIGVVTEICYRKD